jgi:hypothetical protein
VDDCVLTADLDFRSWSYIVLINLHDINISFDFGDRLCVAQGPLFSFSIFFLNWCSVQFRLIRKSISCPWVDMLQVPLDKLFLLLVYILYMNS